MKRVWLVLPGLLFIGLLTAAVLRQGGDVRPGDASPRFTAELLEGSGTRSLDDLAGKPVVLNFWASWCVPCKDEAPMFKAAQERYGDDVHLVGMNIRDAKTDASAFVEKYELDYLQLRDESLQVYDDYGLTGQPETFFIDDRGVLVEHIAGPVTEEQLFSLIDILVARDAS